MSMLPWRQLPRRKEENTSPTSGGPVCNVILGGVMIHLCLAHWLCDLGQVLHLLRPCSLRPWTADCSLLLKVIITLNCYKISIRKWIYSLWVPRIQEVVTVDLLFLHHHSIFLSFCTSCAFPPWPTGAHAPGRESLGWQMPHEQEKLSRPGKQSGTRGKKKLAKFEVSVLQLNWF